MLKKIAIHIEKEFSNNIWRLVFGLYELCHGGNSSFGEEDFCALRACSVAIRYHEDTRPIDAIAVFGTDLDYQTLINEIDNKTVFFISIVYVKNNASVGDPNLLPLIAWLSDNNKQNEKLDFSFGIDVSGLDQKSKNRYIYTNGQKLSIIDVLPTPRASRRCVYYIDNYNNRIITKSFPYSLSHDAPGSSRSLLLPIDKCSVESYFDHQRIVINNPFQEILNKSIKSIKIHLDTDFTCSFLEEWLAKGYLASINNKEETINQQYDETKDIFHEYSNNIYELVQNIILHTDEKNGWLSIRFYKKSDIQVDLREKIPFFQDYSSDDRFLVFELSDNGQKGIVNTFYKENEEIKIDDNDKDESLGNAQLGLRHFFDPQEMLPDNSIQLILRHVSHLGIKAFVSSIINNGGYFSVETNKTENKKEKLESRGATITDPVEVDGDPGTIYQVILPVKKRQQPITVSIRSVDDTSVLDINKSNNNSDVITVESMLFEAKEVRVGPFDKVTINNKEDQKYCIKRIGDLIINQINSLSQNICLNASDFNIFPPFFLFKLIAYIRLNLQDQHQPETIILYNLDDNIYNRLEGISFLITETISKKNQEIWSAKYATVLISNKLQILSLSGSTKDDFCYINQELRKNYSNALKRIPLAYSQITNEKQKGLNKFIRHYDLDTEIASHIENQVLEQPIEDSTTNGFGCVINIPARLGEKIYIDEFYQADYLFLNGFYAKKFAICVARNIVKQLNANSEKKRVVLLGYHQYSKLLIDCVSKILTDYSKQCSKHDYYVENSVIGYEGRKKDAKIDKDTENDSDTEKESNDLVFDFVNVSSHDNADLQGEKHHVVQNEKCVLITIVPIATTLTTFDKLISRFKKEQPLFHVDSEYNYCTILVRDRPKGVEELCEGGQTKMESEWGWTGVDETNRTVSVGLRTIHFLCSKKTRWHRLIDEATFPNNDFSEEKFIVRTRNASLNVNNLLGYPQMSIPPDKNNEQLSDYYGYTGDRLIDMKSFIHFGHLKLGDKHYRYYFDIPGYINESNKKIQLLKSGLENNKIIKWPQLYNWVVEYLKEPYNKQEIFTIGGKLRDKEARINVLVTVEPDKNPQLTSFINKYLFNNSAYVLFLDIHDHDIKYKHSIIRQLEVLRKQYDAIIKSQVQEHIPGLSVKDGDKFINYYFVDQALLTGNSYFTAKRQIAEILNDPTFKFDGVVTIINRLSKFKYNEISNDLLIQNGIYSFNHFFVPSCKSENADCYLCNQRDFYKSLKKNSVITDCRNIIELNKSKYNEKVYSNDEKNEIEDKDRVFKRMQWQNRIFYEVSNANLGDESIKAKTDHIEKILDTLFRKECNTIDDKIAFIKAVSTPPLSDYARIRRFAFNMMLQELKNGVFKLNEKKEDRNYSFNDFILLKVLLKHLALLGSNSLVRKQVIQESWLLYKKVLDNLPSELTELFKRINGSITEMEKCVKESRIIITKDDVDTILKALTIKGETLDQTILRNVNGIKKRIQLINNQLVGQQLIDFDDKDDKEIILTQLKDEIKQVYDINDYIIPINDEGTLLNDKPYYTRFKSRIRNYNNKINQFPRQLIFYIKIATHDDPSKSLWLGELLRTGEEMDVRKYNKYFCVSKTNMYNSIFIDSLIGKDNVLLPHLFYDNTTIIRKTLDNLHKEKVQVDDGKFDLNELLENKDITLDSIKKIVWGNRKQLVSEYNKKVQENYYYNWFRMFYKSDNSRSFIENDESVDGIHLIEKHTMVLYAKLLLKRFANQEMKNDTFDNNANHLLEVFAEIIDAQAAYISIKPRGDNHLIHTLSIYYRTDDYFIEKDSITYDNTFYCTKLLDNKITHSDDITINRGRPFVMRKKLEKNGFGYGERFDGKFSRAAYLTLTINQPINDDSGRVKDETVGLVTFLFGKKQQENIKDNDFIKEKQELGRLLLLLKPELDNYVKHVSDEKMFEVWAEKEHLAMITMVSNHRLNLGGWDLDNLPPEYYKSIPNSLVMFSDVTIRHMYALLLNYKCIPYNPQRNRGVSLKTVFNKKFILLLDTITDTTNKEVRLSVYGTPPDIFIPGTLTIIRSYIIQMIINAGKYCSGKEIKLVFFDTGFMIENNLNLSNNKIEVMKIELEKKYNKDSMDRFLKSPTPYRQYGFTLISLLYYCDSIGLKCHIEIDKEEKVFRIVINH